MTVIRAAWVALVVAALPAAAAGSAPRTAWEQWVHIPGVVDLAGPRSDGRMVVAAEGVVDKIYNLWDRNPVTVRHSYLGSGGTRDRPTPTKLPSY